MGMLFLDCFSLGTVKGVCVRWAEIRDVDEAIEHLHLWLI
jgi:hypothetical protein